MGFFLRVCWVRRLHALWPFAATAPVAATGTAGVAAANYTTVVSSFTATTAAGVSPTLAANGTIPINAAAVAAIAAVSVITRAAGLQHDVSGVHGLRAFVRFRRGPSSWVRRVRGVFALRPAVAAVAAAGSAIEALQHAA